LRIADCGSRIKNRGSEERHLAAYPVKDQSTELRIADCRLRIGKRRRKDNHLPAYPVKNQSFKENNDSRPTRSKRKEKNPQSEIRN